MSTPPTNAIPAAEMEPKEFKIAPWGEFAGIDGVTRIVNAVTLKILPDYQRATGHDEVVLDFEHNTVPKLDGDGQPIAPPEKKDPITIAGYGHVEARENEGLFLVMTWWTPEGAAAYKSGSYKDLSPTILVHPKTNEVIGIHSVALTRAGQIPGLVAYSADMAVYNNTNKTTKPNNNMDEHKKLLAAIVAGLKQVNPECTITEDSSLDDVIAALSGAFKPLSAEAEETKKEDPAPPVTEAKNADAAQGGETIAELTKKMEAMSAQIESLTGKTDDAEKSALIEAALNEGKELPMSVESIKKLPIPTLKEMLGGLRPNMVPMSSGHFASQGAKPKPTAAEAEMRRQWGLN